MLSVIDVLVVHIIKFLVLDCRENDMSVTFGIMNFLADNVQAGTIPNCTTFSSLITLLEKYVKNEDLNNSLRKLGTSSMEDMFSFNDVLKKVFILKISVTFNRLTGPIHLAQNSFLGIIIRSYFARWESLSFEDACLLVERINLFVGEGCSELACNDSSSFVSYYGSSSLTDVASKSLENGDISVTEDAIHSYFDCNEVEPASVNSTTKLRALAQELNSFGKRSSQQYNKSSSSVGRHQMAMLGLATMWSSSLPVGNVQIGRAHV